MYIYLLSSSAAFLIITCILGLIAMYYFEKFYDNPPKLKRKKFYKAICTWSIIIVILLLVGIVITVNIIDHDKERVDIKSIVYEMKEIIGKSREFIETCDINEKEWKTAVQLIKKVYADGLVSIDSLIRPIESSVIFEWKKLDELEQDLFGSTIQLHDSINAEHGHLMCRENLFNYLNIMQIHIYSTSATISSIIEQISGITRSLDNVRMMVRRITDAQAQSDYGSNLMSEKKKTMKVLLNHLLFDVNQFEYTEERINRKLKEGAPLVITGLMIKIVVTTICVLFCALCIVTLYAHYRPMVFGETTPSEAIGYVLLVAALCCCSFIVGLILGNLENEYECGGRKYPISIYNFTTTLYYLSGKRSFHTCPSSESTFFTSILPLVTLDDVENELKIQQYIERMGRTFDYIPGFNIPSDFANNLESMKNISELVEMSIANCSIGYTHTRNLKRKMNSFLEFTRKGHNKFETLRLLIENKGELMHSNMNKIGIEVLRVFEDAIWSTIERCSLADFNCADVNKKFTDVGSILCQRFESPPDTILTFTIVLLIISFALTCISAGSWIVIKSIDATAADSTTPTTTTSPCHASPISPNDAQ